MKTCYITFEADPSKEYAYRCGGLVPSTGQKVVVSLRDGRLKLVTCSRCDATEDPKATAFIFGIVQEQPNAGSL